MMAHWIANTPQPSTVAACQRTYLDRCATVVGTGNLSHCDRPQALRDKGNEVDLRALRGLIKAMGS